MNKLLLSSLFLLFVAGLTRAQPGFQKLYDFEHTNPAEPSCQFRSTYADTTRIIGIGFTYKDTFSNLSTLHNYTTFLAATDYFGNVLWEYKLNFQNPAYYLNEPYIRYNIIKTSTGKYVLGAHAYDFTDTVSRPFLYWFNGNGDSLNFAALPLTDNSNNHLYGILEDDAGNIMATGFYVRDKYITDTAGFWLAKFSSEGAFLWKKTIADTPFLITSAFAAKIIKGNRANEYLLSGLAVHPDTARYTKDAIWKVDSAGNVLWRKHIPKLYDWPTNIWDEHVNFDIIRASNGSGYYFATYAPKTVPGAAFQKVFYCGKLDEDGNLLWAKTYERDGDHNDEPRGLLQRKNGDLLFNGGSYLRIGGGAASMLLTDSLGNAKWYKEYRYVDDCNFNPVPSLYTINQTPSGSILRAGFLWQPEHQVCWDSIGGYSLLVYTDSLGRLHPNDTVTIPITEAPAQYGPVGIKNPQKQEKGFLIYPNPATDKVKVILHKYESNTDKIVLSVYDFMGRKVMQHNIKHRQQTLDISSLIQGVYLLKIHDEGKELGAYKLVKQ